jgi:hypothetical protein
VVDGTSGDRAGVARAPDWIGKFLEVLGTKISA